MKDEVTKVKFYKEPHHGLVDILAVFPDELYNEAVYGKDMITCYAHIGQHSACNLECVAHLQVATKEEYDELLRELEFIGYDNLEVME